MKKTIVTVAMLLGLTTSYAAKNLESTPNVVLNEINIHSIKKGSRLTVINTKGTIIYSEIIKKNASLSQNFDFSNLKDGIYTIELTHDFEVKIQKIAVANHKVSFLEDTTSVFYKPLVRNQDHKVYVSKLELSNQELTVTLFYEGEEIYSETTKDEPIFERIYTLDSNKKGAYSVVVNANNRNYTSYFNL